jgi:chemotaxis protein CheX
MRQSLDAVPQNQYPFALMMRSSDRARLLTQLVAAVWDSTLRFPILPRDDQHDPGQALDALPALTGTLRITGTWEGTVAMSCSPSFAAECGATMYGRSAAELTLTEVLDAWGELLNMVGGNLKALLPAPSRLSLPDVRESPTYLYSEPDARVLNQLTFACLGHRVRLTIVTRQS